MKKIHWVMLGIASFVALAGIVTGFVFLIMSLMKGDAYQLSFNTIVANPEVRRAIGSPIEEGFFVTGNVHTTNTSGDAAIQYSFSGPLGKGAAEVYASKSHGQWQLDEVIVYIENSARIENSNQKIIIVERETLPEQL